MFYSTVEAALADGYTHFDRDRYQDPEGELYSFTGIKSDAKELHFRIIEGVETRVQLVQAQTVED